jgi:hypothetical protein
VVVAVAAGADTRHLHVEELGGEEVEGRFHLGLVDVLAPAGAAPVVEGGQQRGRQEAGAIVSV